IARALFRLVRDAAGLPQGGGDGHRAGRLGRSRHPRTGVRPVADHDCGRYPGVEQTLPYQSSHSSAEWVFEAPFVPVTQASGIFAPLTAVSAANFTKMHAIANGQQVTAGQLVPKEAVLLAPVGAISSIPLALSPDGTSFIDTTGVIQSG